MKKVKTTMVFLVMAIFLTFFVGCSEQTIKLNVEKNLRANATKNGICIADMEHLRGGLSIQKHINGRYELVDSENNSCVYFINDTYKFYEAENPYKNFRFTESSKKMDQKYFKYLDQAKELAKMFVDSSTIIYSEDKDGLKNTIDNVGIHYGKVEDAGLNLDSVLVMITQDLEIYVVEGYEKYYSVATFLHELIHVISNQTNKGSKYETSFYRFSAINEGLTELIARQILIDAGMENQIAEDVAYEIYFLYAYSLMNEFDLLLGYFYSDNYDNIFASKNRDWIDIYYMIVDWGGGEDLQQGIPFWAFAQI